MSKQKKTGKVIPIGPAHAKLSASGSKKWIACTPSVFLEERFPDEDSEFALEGTYMHTLFANVILTYLGRPLLPLPSEQEVTKYHTQELQDAVAAAARKAVERIEHARSVCKDPLILVEQRLDFSKWVPEGFGTGDLVIVTDTYVEVLDLKGGKGVPVSCVENSQFRLYMLGALHTYGHLYDVKTVIGTVLQPRLDNYGSEELTVDQLLAWADEVVVPAAKAAWAGEGEFTPGDHCSEGFCRARFTCAARAESNLAIAKADFALAAPETMTDEQIAQVLTKADDAIKWLGDVKSFALTQASKGRKFDGFKLVAGRSNRVYSNQDAVAQALLAEGIPEAVIFERSLLGITAMEKAIGAKRFAEVLGDLITKPPGKAVLVPMSDKRDALDPTASAISDFS